MLILLVGQIVRLLEKGVSLLMTIDERIAAFKTSMDTVLAKISSGLDNIQQDETNLLQKISDLQAALGGADLTAEQQAALQAVQDAGDALATRTQSVADAVPDTVTPPSA